MKKIEIAAPAKTNLWLRVPRKRDDGYHEVDTRMVGLSLSDQLRIEENGNGQDIVLSCSDESLSVEEDNLVVRAVRALEQHCGRRFSLRIHLEKKIPVAAGLGGGSSDAAAALKGVNQLLDLGLSLEELSQLAAGIGSDVPFFLFDSPCDCRGRGEIVTPVELEQELPILLIRPPFGISAAWAYQNLSDAIEVPGVTYAPQLCPWGEMVNDLERPVFEKYLLLARMKMWLLDQAETRVALLSGSGSCLLVVLMKADSGEDLASRARQRFGETLWTCIGHTLGGSGSVTRSE